MLAINPKMPIVLRQFKNGGWIVTNQYNDRGLKDEEVGAYSNAAAMLADLAAVLDLTPLPALPGHPRANDVD